MQIPTPAEVRQYLREFQGYCWAVLCHYYLLLGGVVVGATVTALPESYQGVRMSGWWITAFLVFVATFLAWREHQPTPRIALSCGKEVEGCVSKDNLGIWYRARLDLTGPNVSGVEATMIGIWENGTKVNLHGENLDVSMCEKEQRGQTVLMREGRPEYINLLFAAHDASKPPVLSLKHYPAPLGERAYFKLNHEYQMSLVITCDNPHPSVPFTVKMKLKSNDELEEFQLI